MGDNSYPLMFSGIARAYKEYAALMYEKRITDEFYHPLYFMIGHAYELVLKAFLLSKGYKINDLKKR